MVQPHGRTHRPHEQQRRHQLGGHILKKLFPRNSWAPLAALSFVCTGLALGAVFGGGSVPAKPVASTIYVRNLSTFVTDAEVKNDIPAFQDAISKDFAPLWNIDAKLVFLGKDAAPTGTIVVNLRDRSDVEGALAYHDVVNGRPGAEVFVGTSRYLGYRWSVGFMHEVFEMLVDPSINVAQQDMNTARVWAAEVGDPVESDADGYNRPGADGSPVRISDFITPKWFGAPMAGPYDFAEHIQAPGVIDKGGYAQFWTGFSWELVSNFRKGGHDDAFLLGEEAVETRTASSH